MTRFARTILVRPLLGLTALALFAAAGCSGGDNSVTPGIDPTVGNPRRSGNLEINLVTDKRSYAVGDPIQFTYTIKNVATSTLTLVYPQSVFTPTISTTSALLPIAPQGGMGFPCLPSHF